MKRVTIAFLIWTGFCIIGMTLLWKIPSVKWEHPGKDVTFTASYDSQFVTNKPAIIEAASSNFFLLHNTKTNEVISALPAPKPLGWVSDEYYTVGPVDFSAGTWLIVKGSTITIHLSAESDIKTVASNNDEKQLSGWFWITIICLVIWIIGRAIGSEIKWDEI